MEPETAPRAARGRLRIAIQKNGRLSEPARALLAHCGLTWHRSADDLYCHGESMPIDLLLVRDDDICGLIADGLCDVGIVGRNVFRERAAGFAPAGPPDELQELRVLGFGGCRLSIAMPEARPWSGPDCLRGMRIATSHPRLLEAWLREHGIDARVVALSGSVEIAPQLGQADAICDLVASGATLRANRLREVAPVLNSEAVLVGTRAALPPVLAELADMLVQRIDGVARVRETRLLMCQAPRAALPELMELLPDAEHPTWYALERNDLYAVQALCHSAMTWQRLEALKRAGAQSLMVLPVERMLA